MKRILTFFLPVIFACLSTDTAVAQPTIEWQASPNPSGIWGDWGSYLIQTKDGGYAFAGQITVDTSTDAVVTKMRSDGSIQWQKYYGGNANDVVYSIIQTYDGGYLFGGRTNSILGEGIFHHGSMDVWIVKLDSNGAMQWQQCYGGSGFDEARCVIQTYDSNFVFAGIVNSKDGDVIGDHSNAQDIYHGATRDAWVAKIDRRGKLLWQKCLGGGLREWGNSIIQNPDSTLVFAGSTESSDGNVLGNSKGALALWVVKLKDTLILWQKCLVYGGGDEAFSLCRTRDGGYVVTATIDDNDTVAANSIQRLSDLWTVKLDSSGSLLWQRCMGGSNYDGSFSVATTNDGGSVVAGYTTSNDGDLASVRNGKGFGGNDVWIIKFTSDGKLEWDQRYGGNGSDLAYSIIQTADGGYAFAGHTESKDGDVTSNPKGAYNTWVVKLKSDVASVSSKKIVGLTFSIIPNPTMSEVTIQYTAGEQSKTQFEISDLLGNRIIQTTDNNTSIGERQMKFDVSKLPQGIYTVRLLMGSDIMMEKFTIVR